MEGRGEGERKNTWKKTASACRPLLEFALDLLKEGREKKGEKNNRPSSASSNYSLRAEGKGKK